MNSKPQTKTKARDSALARFMLGFEGDSLPGELSEYLARGLAGVVLYARNYPSAEHLRELTAEIRRAAGRPVLIGIDQEGGTRFALREPFTAWPSATQLGRIGDPALTEQVARAMAVELRAVGCNLNFAPMLDLHINSDSPVTTDRSFGADPHCVAKMGVAFDRGLRAGRVLSCAKHFPGHGDAVVDPHLDLPVFMGAMERLASVELVPFAAAVAGARSARDDRAYSAAANRRRESSVAFTRSAGRNIAPPHGIRWSDSCRRPGHGSHRPEIRARRGCRADTSGGNGRCHAVPRLVRCGAGSCCGEEGSRRRPFR